MSESLIVFDGLYIPLLLKPVWFYYFAMYPETIKPHVLNIFHTVCRKRCSGIMDVHAAWVYCFKRISKRWNWIGRGVEEINWLGLSDMSSVLTFCWPLNWIIYNHSHPRPPPRICCLDLDTVSIADLENICVLPQYKNPVQENSKDLGKYMPFTKTVAHHLMA